MNQPLAAIANNANACLGLLSDRAPEVDEVRAALEDMVNDAERASAIVERVRVMSRRRRREERPLQLDELVDDVVAPGLAGIASAATSHRGRGADADLPAVVGRPRPAPAGVAQPGGERDGRDERASTAASEARDSGTRGDARRPRLCADPRRRTAGEGLDPEDADELFEAFYTTKPQGMGLGLAISRSIIEAHGGRAVGGAECRDKGHVFVPSAGGRGGDLVSETPSEAAVFVVDDDASVRRSTERLVRSTG